MNTIENKVKRLLETKNLTILELAKRIGTSNQNLHRILKADDIKISHLEKIAEVLNVPVSYFFNESGTTNVNETNKELEALKQEVKDLKEREKNYFKMFDTLNGELNNSINHYNFIKQENNKLEKQIAILEKKLSKK